MSYVDLYCERLAPGLLGEPLNAASNLAFFAAAVWVWQRADQAGAWRGKARVLAALLALIGAGSLTFHTWATTWAEMLDELPILVFQLVFLGFYLRRVLAWHSLAVGTGILAFVAAIFTAGHFPTLINGSLPYLPAFLVLGGIGVFHRITARAGGNAFLLAAVLFCLSLTLRSIDLALCPVFPYGTHLFWHLCNAVMLALAVHGLLQAGQENPALGCPD